MFFSEKMRVFNHEKSNQSLQGPGFDMFHPASVSLFFPRKQVLRRIEYCSGAGNSCALSHRPEDNQERLGKPKIKLQVNLLDRVRLCSKGGRTGSPQNHGSRI